MLRCSQDGCKCNTLTPLGKGAAARSRCIPQAVGSNDFEPVKRFAV